jgi:hypothetical protein
MHQLQVLVELVVLEHLTILQETVVQHMLVVEVVEHVNRSPGKLVERVELAVVELELLANKLLVEQWNS